MSTAFENRVIKVWNNKRNNARQRGLGFDLTLLSVRNLLRAKRCYYTGVPLRHKNYNSEGNVNDKQKNKPNDFTIERIDSSKGYVKGNVVAVSRAANEFKGIFENPQNGHGMTMQHLVKMVNKISKKNS